MNVKIITAVIFVLIILGGLGIFFMNGQNTKQLVERISPTGTDGTAMLTSDMPGATLATSRDQRVSFRYPKSWHLTDTTTPNGRGEFGAITQSWVLQSFPSEEAGKDGIVDNSAKIDIEIQTGGGNLPIEDLVECTMKSTTCEKIAIDNEQFIRNETTLNNGMKTITIATFYDDKILRMSARIAPGSKQNELTKTVNAIFHSITFSPLPES